jgi:hypothetical protein
LSAVQVPTLTRFLTDNLSEPLRPTKTSKEFLVSCIILSSIDFSKEYSINWRGEKENEYLAYKNGKGTG